VGAFGEDLDQRQKLMEPKKKGTARLAVLALRTISGANYGHGKEAYKRSDFFPSPSSCRCALSDLGAEQIASLYS
jgi:hypothetical protein